MIIPQSIDYVLPHHAVLRQERIRLFNLDDAHHSQYWLVAGGLTVCLVAIVYHFRKQIPCLSWYEVIETQLLIPAGHMIASDFDATKTRNCFPTL
jgi:hypothetical protein